MTMKNFISTAFIAALTLLTFASCDKTGTGGKVYENSKTIFVYAVAENSLFSDIANDVNEMINGASRALGEHDHLVVYVDDLDYPRIYHIDRNNNPDVGMYYLKPVLSYKKDFNSCSVKAMKDAIKYTMSNYPAEKYGVVLWSHGSGWIKARKRNVSSLEAHSRSFGIDNGINSTSDQKADEMDITELQEALGEFGGLEFVLFDACFMQTIEVAYQLRNVTKYLIASPAEIPSSGADYTSTLPCMFSKPLNYRVLLDNYQKGYTSVAPYGVLLSVIDCEQLEPFAAATRSYVRQYRERMLAISYLGVVDYFLYDQWKSKASFPDFYDMRSVMANVMSSSDYANWMVALNMLVPYSTCTPLWMSGYSSFLMPLDVSQYGGISMFVPLDKYGKSFSEYSNTDWAKEVWM